jgi:hypothetical protein
MALLGFHKIVGSFHFVKKSNSLGEDKICNLTTLGIVSLRSVAGVVALQLLNGHKSVNAADQ